MLNSKDKNQYNQSVDEYVKSLTEVDRLLLFIGMLTGEPVLKDYSHKALCAIATGWSMDKVDAVFEEATAAGYIKRDMMYTDQSDYSNN